MPSQFPQTLRSLEQEYRRGGARALLGVAILAAGWVTWLFAARVSVVVASEEARLEISGAAHPLNAVTAGRIARLHVSLGQQVREGDLLVELESRTEQLELAEHRARLASFQAQLKRVDAELAEEDRLQASEQTQSGFEVQTSRAQNRQAEIAAGHAERELERAQALFSQAAIASAELERVRAEAQQLRAQAHAQGSSSRELSSRHQTRQSERQLEREKVGRDRTVLEGQIAQEQAIIARLEHVVSLAGIRAPTGGRIGELSSLTVGQSVVPGDRLGTVVPTGRVQVVASFLPVQALGRLAPGEPARVRLSGFSWLQFGTLAATVRQVGNEPGNGRVRVELDLADDQTPALPREHGLPGTVEVEVEQVRPITLVLRAIGREIAPARTPVSSAAGAPP